MKKIISNQKLNGFIVSNFIAMAIAGISIHNVPAYRATVFIYSEFIIIPLFIGIVSAWFWRSLNLTGGHLINYSIINTFCTILLSAVFLGEGIICLIIVSPLLWTFITTGAFLGRSIFRKRNKTLNVSVVSLLFFVFISDALSKHEYKNMVSDTIVVNAPCSKVWKNVVAFKKIKKKSTFWLCRLGLPSPLETTVDGYYKGAGRKCIFSNGYVFDEKISIYEPGRDLVFDITNQPRDPEIMNHLDLLRGEFLVKDNGNGTTTLTGNSWYRLYVFPSWYYDLWTQSIIRNVHLRVMKHIKQLSEE